MLQSLNLKAQILFDTWQTSQHWALGSFPMQNLFWCESVKDADPYFDQTCQLMVYYTKVSIRPEIQTLKFIDITIYLQSKSIQNC